MAIGAIDREYDIDKDKHESDEEIEKESVEELTNQRLYINCLAFTPGFLIFTILMTLNTL